MRHAEFKSACRNSIALRSSSDFRARVWHGSAKEALSTSMELQWFGGEWQDVLRCAILAGSAFHVVENLEESLLARSGPVYPCCDT